MKKYINLLKDTVLFSGTDADELSSMLKCLGAEARSCEKDEVILLTGDKPEHIGVVLSGRLHIIREDYDGNRRVIAAVSQGEIYAEALCCAGVSESPVTVIADTASSILTLGFARILHMCPNACPFHTRLIRNMLRIVAEKNLQLQGRMEIVSLRSVRARVICYLEGLAIKQGADITVPFNREQLADFLCVERSALSHELSRMKRDGLIEYRKNRFIFNIKRGQK